MSTFTSLRAGALFAVLLALVLAACGSAGADATPPADEVEPTDAPASEASEAGEAADAASRLCALVPIEEVELALGATTDGGVGDESSIFGGQSCRFTADAEHVLDVSTSEQTRDEWLDAITTVGLTDEVVEGVGEEAYRAPETALGGPGARFTAWADGFEVGVTVYSDEAQETTFAAAQAIAEAVLAAAP